MREVVLKESEIDRLKEYPLDGIMSTESKIYYYKKDENWNSHLLKRLYRTDEERVYRKERTIEALQRSELSTYPELVIPEELVVIQGIKSGFTIKEVTDCTNLQLFLEDKTILNKDKILVLQKIGKLLRKVQSQDQEFYFGDLQSYNFLVNKDLDVFAVDLDSSAVTRKKPIETKYIIIDKKAHSVNKYKVNKAKRCYPNRNIDIFCYDTMVLNFLAGTSTNRFTYYEYYEYINYLEEIGYPKELIDVYINLYTDKANIGVEDYLLDLPKDFARGNYGVFKALKKLKR